MAFLPTTPGLSFYSIPIAWILSLVPHVFAVKTYEAASSRKFDNTQPRSLTTTVASDQSLSKATKDVCPNFHNVSPLSIQSASARGSKMSMSTLYIRMVRTNKANSTPPPPDHHPRRRSPAERVREPRHLRRWRRRGQCRRLGRGLLECAEYGIYRQQGRVQSCVHQQYDPGGGECQVRCLCRQLGVDIHDVCERGAEDAGGGGGLGDGWTSVCGRRRGVWVVLGVCSNTCHVGRIGYWKPPCVRHQIYPCAPEILSIRRERGCFPWL